MNDAWIILATGGKVQAELTHVWQVHIFSSIFPPETKNICIPSRVKLWIQLLKHTLLLVLPQRGEGNAFKSYDASKKVQRGAEMHGCTWTIFPKSSSESWNYFKPPAVQLELFRRRRKNIYNVAEKIFRQIDDSVWRGREVKERHGEGGRGRERMVESVVPRAVRWPWLNVPLTGTTDKTKALWAVCVCVRVFSR